MSEPETNVPGCRASSALKDRFAWHEKLVMRVGLVAIVVLGAAAMWLDSPLAAVAYLVFGAVGGLLLVYDLVCVYCPYPFQYSDCLFFPYQLLARVTRMREGAIPGWRKGLLVVVFGGLVLAPQYWLWGKWGLLAGFWGAAAVVGLLVPVCCCRRCRHRRCPLNMADGSR